MFRQAVLRAREVLSATGDPQQADLVLLGLCCAATLYGMALIASATRYLNIGGIVRYVGVQGAGHGGWASAPISSCPCWTWSG